MGKKSRKKAKAKKHSGIFTDAARSEIPMDEINTETVSSRLERDSLMSVQEHLDVSKEDSSQEMSSSGKISAKMPIEKEKSSSKMSVISSQEFLKIMFFHRAEVNDLHYIVDIVKDGDVDILAVNDQGENLLHIAARCGHIDIVKYFSHGKNDPLCPKPKDEDMDIFKRLINTQDKDGHYPIQTAAKHNKHEIVSLLLSLTYSDEWHLTDYIISNYEGVLMAGTTIQKILAGLEMLNILKHTDRQEVCQASSDLSQKLTTIMSDFDPKSLVGHIGPRDDMDVFLDSMTQFQEISTVIFAKVSIIEDQMSEEIQRAFFNWALELRQLMDGVERLEEIVTNKDIKLLTQKLKEASEVIKSEDLEDLKNVENANKVLWSLNAYEQIGVSLLRTPNESLSFAGNYMKLGFTDLLKRCFFPLCNSEKLKITENESLDPIKMIRAKIYELSPDITSLIDEKEKIKSTDDLINRLEETLKVLEPMSWDHIARDTKNANNALWGLNALEQIGYALLTAPTEALQPQGRHLRELFPRLFEKYLMLYAQEEEQVQFVDPSDAWSHIGPLIDPTAIRSQICGLFPNQVLIGKEKIDVADGLLDSFFDEA